MEKAESRRILPVFLFFVLLALLLLLVENFGLTKEMRSKAEGLMTPFKSAVYQKFLAVKKTWGAFRGKTAEIEKLKKQEQELAALTVSLKVLTEENQALRHQLEAPLPPSTKFLPAKTIGLSRYLMIDKGEEDGVSVGMTVVVGNRLVGRIISISQKTAQIVLPRDPDAKIPARTLKTGANGLVVGEFNTKVILDKVLQAESLEVGDLVVTIGDDNYGRDLLIGKIEKVEKREVQPFQRAEVRPLLDYQKLADVFVIMSN